MNKALAEMVVKNWKRHNNIDVNSEFDALNEYREGIKFINEVEETMKVSGVHDPAYEFLCRQRQECYRLVDALNTACELGLRDHEQSFKIMASYPVKNWMKEEMFVEEIEVFISKQYRTHNKDFIEQQIERSYRIMKEGQGVSSHALKNLEIIVI